MNLVESFENNSIPLRSEGPLECYRISWNLGTKRRIRGEWEPLSQQLIHAKFVIEESSSRNSNAILICHDPQVDDSVPTINQIVVPQRNNARQTRTASEFAELCELLHVPPKSSIHRYRNLETSWKMPHLKASFIPVSTSMASGRGLRSYRVTFAVAPNEVLNSQSFLIWVLPLKSCLFLPVHVPRFYRQSRSNRRPLRWCFRCCERGIKEVDGGASNLSKYLSNNGVLTGLHVDEYHVLREHAPGSRLGRLQ